MALSKRHIAKAITWRIIGSLDTLLLAYLFTGSIASGIKISGIEVITKVILFYFHEKFWYNSNLKNANQRHFVKTITWRIVGTLDTVVISTLISGNPFIGLKIGGTETISKMILYYFHEKLWYRINFGLNQRNSRKHYKK